MVNEILQLPGGGGRIGVQQRCGGEGVNVRTGHQRKLAKQQPVPLVEVAIRQIKHCA
jgi:hypothetical protein